LAALALLAVSLVHGQDSDIRKFLEKARTAGGDVPAPTGSAVALTEAPKLPAGPSRTLRDQFFDQAKAVLLNKGGKPEKVRCLILAFIEEHPKFRKLDDAGYEKEVDATIDNTEMYFLDYSCRDKLKATASSAMAIPSGNRKKLGAICGYAFPDTDKDIMVLWASVEGSHVSLPRNTAAPPISAHEVMHLLLNRLSANKTMADKGTIHHGLTNRLQWGRGDPTTPWSPSAANAEKCKDTAAAQGTAASVGLAAGSSDSGGDAETSDEDLSDVPEDF
jgi:hypothetical protein